DGQNVLAQIVESVVIEIDAIQPGGQPGMIQAVLDPKREIVGLELQAKPRIDEVIVQRLMSQVAYSFRQFGQSPRRRARGYRHLFRFAKIKRLECPAVHRLWMFLQVIADNVRQNSTQILE